LKIGAAENATSNARKRQSGRKRPLPHKRLERKFLAQSQKPPVCAVFFIFGHVFLISEEINFFTGGNSLFKTR